MRRNKPPDVRQPVAGNGLLDRRAFMSKLGMLTAGGALHATVVKPANAAPLEVPDWMKTPGKGMSPYGEPSPYEAHVKRSVTSRPGTTGSGVSKTPLEHLQGIITPNPLHFERHHNGIPDIDPSQHRLAIHGLVERPLLFDVDSLSRYPLESRIHFIECAGNSASSYLDRPVQDTAGGIHGLISCSEWTGVRLSILLNEAGIKPAGKWLLAEGADAAAMSRSIPVGKAMDDVMIALYQNGERLRPGNGYPMRLLLPGWEGSMNTKWLRRLEVTDQPMMTRDETARYTDLLVDGKAQMFTFPMGVKSTITSPSGGGRMRGPGLYEVSGLAWSGFGRIRQVEVSADGGKTWADAALSEPVLPKALTRFRIPWHWTGGKAILQSRATDETGNRQPSRQALIDERGANYIYHFNGIQSWKVTPAGDVRNVFA